MTTPALPTPVSEFTEDFHTFTLCRADWYRVITALKARATTYEDLASQTTGGSTTYFSDEADIHRAIAADIDFIIP